jgi:hypothetical protein
MNQKFFARNTRPTSARRNWEKRWMAQLPWMTQQHANVLNVDTSIPKFPINLIFHNDEPTKFKKKQIIVPHK